MNAVAIYICRLAINYYVRRYIRSAAHVHLNITSKTICILILLLF